MKILTQFGDGFNKNTLLTLLNRSRSENRSDRGIISCRERINHNGCSVLWHRDMQREHGKGDEESASIAPPAKDLSEAHFAE